MTARTTRAVLATLAVVGLLALGEGPAAASHRGDALPEIVIAPPATVGAGAGTVAGSVSMRNLLATVESISVEVVSTTGSAGPQSFSVCSGGCGYDSFSDRRSYSVAPSYPANGTYRATVTATGRFPLFPPVTGSESVTFGIRQPAAAPTGLDAEVGDRTVVLSWNRVTAHPDVSGYVVRVKGPGESAFGPAVAVAHPASGSKVSFSFSGVGDEGGRYEFSVQTVRPGAAVSDPSDAVFSAAVTTDVTVEAVPPTTGSPSTTTGTTAPAGTAPQANAGQIGGFLNDAIRNAPTPARPTIPDTGFDSTLPFEIDPNRFQGELEGRLDGALGEGEGSGRVAATVVDDDVDNRRKLLVPIAGGAVLCMAALHLRVFSRRLGVPAGGFYEAGEPIDAQPWEVEDAGYGDSGYGGPDSDEEVLSGQGVRFFDAEELLGEVEPVGGSRGRF